MQIWHPCPSGTFQKGAIRMLVTENIRIERVGSTRNPRVDGFQPAGYGLKFFFGHLKITSK